MLFTGDSLLRYPYRIGFFFNPPIEIPDIALANPRCPQSFRRILLNHIIFSTTNCGHRELLAMNPLHERQPMPLLVFDGYGWIIPQVCSSFQKHLWGMYSVQFIRVLGISWIKPAIFQIFAYFLDIFF